MKNPFIIYKTILEKYFEPNFIKSMFRAWTNPSRKFHNIEHLNYILTYIEKHKFNIDNKGDYISLILAAFFHDLFYDVRFNNNEDQSKSLFLIGYKDNDNRLKYQVLQLIEITKFRKVPIDKIEKLFWNADNEVLTLTFDKLLEYEKQIKQEYHFVSNSLYKEKRIEFLKSNLGLFDKNVDDNVNKLIDYVQHSY